MGGVELGGVSTEVVIHGWHPLAFSRISQNSHVNKTYWEQFQIYAPPSLRVIQQLLRVKGKNNIRTI